ncbi:MAG: 50S ribosomal protein L24 [Chloroflexi bacterium]|nr:50S ribosomal protein L24 [Chloroflexota bacterium]
MRIKKGDTVEVISGNDKGARGTVHRVLPGKRADGSGKPDPNRDAVVISGVNIIKKHQRRTGDVRTQVGIIEREAPIHISNVALVCPHCNNRTRVGYQFQADGTKVRVCKRCQEIID